MRVERWLNALPDGSVVGAYDPHMKGAPGHKVGTAWMWRKEDGEWVIVGGGYHGTAYVATHPNLTLIYNPHRPPRIGTLTPAQLADLDPHDRASTGSSGTMSETRVAHVIQPGSPAPPNLQEGDRIFKYGGACSGAVDHLIIHDMPTGARDNEWIDGYAMTRLAPGAKLTWMLRAPRDD